MVEAKIVRIGNSLGLRLPKGLLDTYDLKENDVVEITPKKDKIDLTLRKKH